MEENKAGYILVFDCGDYVESYDLANKTVDTSCMRKDAIVFQSKSEASYVAEILGCKVKYV
ncbi:hypothetical protein M3204_14115 [Mesobacillus subterraneus]|uniref:hypothetical protein n=1 Tax=Mesobacillus subterraneus TaxID=285983 RepID=UPI002041CA09|nr:hypothetical protein [Mesobacillus subterraneus]MCM3665549.1 hypothetical protein [Mesobacillus subterraneus]MCM3686108.1 hypothetical protein [Mesobacillus subterraneus]